MPESSLTKSDVLSALRKGGDDAVARLKAMPADSFEVGRYENGWNGRQILAHLASIEWTYPRLIDVARDGPPPAKPAAAPAVPSTPSAPILSYNDRQVEQRANATVDELLTEFETNRKTTIAAVESADEALFSQPVKSAGGARGTLAEVLNYVAVLHVAQHVQDITGPPA
jgi:DinB family protein